MTGKWVWASPPKDGQTVTSRRHSLSRTFSAAYVVKGQQPAEGRVSHYQPDSKATHQANAVGIAPHCSADRGQRGEAAPKDEARRIGELHEVAGAPAQVSVLKLSTGV
jgi:hypothetical protein